MKNVTLVEINVYDGMVPLVSGYLEAYARTDPIVAARYEFKKYSLNRKTPVPQILEQITQQRSDVYAFSCYIWNMGIVRSLIAAISSADPQAFIILGGPQVMHHAGDYLSPEYERMLICNGEGEITFKEILRDLLGENRNFDEIKGISFYRDGRIVNTAPQDRIRNLDEIPSPFQSGLFDGNYRVSVLETNRGCPFRCGFCFWGAATNDKVCKFSEERVQGDLKWISSNQVPFVVIADANWGMLKRDIEFSRSIAKCKETDGTPVYVYFSAAKNSPQRVSQITQIFQAAGVFNAQPISMQSLDISTLEKIDRQNIKLTAYAELQDDLNEKGINSFIELIWPLPGETLETFKSGIEKLIDGGAANIVVYPHLLLHNTPLYENRREHGLVARSVDDAAAEAEIVVETSAVSSADFEDGMWFYYAVLALHNTRSLEALRRYLHTSGTVSFSDQLTTFANFAKSRPRHPFSTFCRDSIEDAHYYDVFNYPMVYFSTLHEHRGEFDELLQEFARSQDWWGDDAARFLFEVGMLCRPYLFSNTPFSVPDLEFDTIEVMDASSRRYVVQIPEEYVSLVDEVAKPVVGSPARQIVELNHHNAQIPHRGEQSLESVADYCSGAVMRAGTILPRWSAL